MNTLLKEKEYNETDIELDLYGEYSNVTTKIVFLKWKYELEYRSWGIKNVSITIPDQKIYVEIEVEDENGDYERKDIVIELKNIEMEGETKIPLLPTKLTNICGRWVVEF